MTNVESVLDAVANRIKLDQQKLEQNLAWLQAEMHRYFFSFNKDDTINDALLEAWIKIAKQLTQAPGDPGL